MAISHPECTSNSCIRDLQFIGNSPEIVKLLETVRRAAITEAPILITGESGTGKEILAETIHRLSLRFGGPYVAVNCGAIVGSLEESELFGYVRGAFTGATQSQKGRFEAANGGTLFLDEIGETSPSFQIKLLRVLQQGEYNPVGSVQARQCDVRIVAATNRNLTNAVEDGLFRSDLYFRLNVVRLHVPPLRERKEDIPFLVSYFIDQYCRLYGIKSPSVQAGFFKALMAYHYPGNVRELSNFVHRAVVFSENDVLSAKIVEESFPDFPRTPCVGSLDSHAEKNPQENCEGKLKKNEEQFHIAKKRLVETFEREYLIGVLAECGGIISRAAECAGLSERGMHQKLKQYGINGNSYRTGD